MFETQHRVQHQAQQHFDVNRLGRFLRGTSVGFRNEIEQTLCRLPTNCRFAVRLGQFEILKDLTRGLYFGTVLREILFWIPLDRRERLLEEVDYRSSLTRTYLKIADCC